MASRRFPDTGSRYVIDAEGNRASSAAITYYEDPAGQTLAEVYAERGTDTPDPADALVGSSTTLDAYGGQVDFRGPTDGTKVLYAQVGVTGPIFQVRCEPRAELDSLDTRTTALEAGGAGDALLVHRAGAETITGVKTHTVSPIVPTPTTDMQAATKAYADAVQAAAVQRANHTGTQSADTIVDGTTNKAFLATERTLLADMATHSALPTPMEGMTVAARGTDPIPTEWFDDYFWAVDTSGVIKRSSDGGTTWSTYCTVPNVESDAADISRILPCDDNEVLVVSTLLVQRSTGWAGGSPTWTTVLTNPTTSSIYPWGADGDGTKFIVVHYAGSAEGSPERADSRYGWISTDGGHTFTAKWDSDAKWGSAINALTHLHGCAYDSWADRFFISEGHNSVTGIYYSDDDGDTWTKLTYGDSFDTAPTNAPTTITPTDNGIVFGTDDPTNGCAVLRRDSTTIEKAWSRLGISNSTLLGYAHMGARDPVSGLVYVVYEANTGSALDLPCHICASDGQVADSVWVEPTPGGLWRRIAIDDQGRVLAWEQRTGQIAKGRVGGIGARPGHLQDTGRVLGGTVTGGRRSVAVGAEATAIGDSSVAVGGGATTTTHNGTAVGASASATGSGQAFGTEAEAQALGLAVGYQANTTNGLAVGYAATALNAACTAIGRGARAATDAGAAVPDATAVGRDAKANSASGNTVAVGNAATASGASGTAVGETSTASATSTVALGQGSTAAHSGAVALGQGTATTATNQVQIGARHVELTELAADPAAPAENGARWYVRDNGAGKTQLCVRFATGAVQVIATEP